MNKSLGKALSVGVPSVFFSKNRVPILVCGIGKEKQALEVMEKMGMIKVVRPILQTRKAI